MSPASAATDHWVRVWVEQVDDLLRSPLPAFPHQTLFPLLAETFEAIPTWNELGLDGHMHLEMYEPPARWPDEGTVAGWGGDRWWEHPLIRWFMVSESLQPMSTGRVPSGVVLAGGSRFVDSQLRPHDLHQQLCLPVGIMGASTRSLVLAQGGSDFTEGQLTLARALQPLLMVLDRQSRAHGWLSRTQTTLVADWGLTGRETAVLRLLSRGLTASAMGRQLACSPRTVDKHIEHIYRKLGVRDRASAARLAVAHGLATEVPAPDEGPQPLVPERVTVLDGTLRPFTPELLG